MIKELKMYPALTCDESESIVGVAKKMKDNEARHIFVVDKENKALGIISSTDFTNKVIAEGKNPAMFKAKDVMNSPVESADINQDAEFAMAIMLRRKTYSCLVTEKNKVKGVIDYKTALERIVKKIKEE